MEAKVEFDIKYDRVMKRVSMMETQVKDAAEVCDYNWKQKKGPVKVGIPLTLIDIIEKCPELANDAIHNTTHVEVTIKWNRENA